MGGEIRHRGKKRMRKWENGQQDLPHLIVQVVTSDRVGAFFAEFSKDLYTSRMNMQAEVKISQDLNSRYFQHNRKAVFLPITEKKNARGRRTCLPLKSGAD